MPTNAINDTGVKYLYDKLHGEIEPVAEAVSEDTSTVTGNPLNFTTLSAQNAESTLIDLEPIQDLHGYDKPWVGGAGKNLLEIVDRDTTYYNVQIISDSEDESVVLNGTANNSGPIEITYYISRCLLKAGTYNVRLFADTSFPNYSSSYFRLVKLETQETLLNVAEINTNYTFTLVEDTNVRGLIRLQNNTVYNNYKFKLMVSKSTDAITNWEPYKNECSISGRTEIGILGCGKNLWKPTDVLEAYFNSSNPITSANNARTAYIKCEANQKYVVSKTAGARFSVGYTKDEPSIGDEVYGVINNNTASSISITTGADAKYLVAFVYSGSADTITAEQMLASVQIEKGETKTTYKPYTKSNDLTISLGQTVYGGTLDVEKGELTIDKASVILNGNEDWVKSGSASIQQGRAGYYLRDNQLSHCIYSGDDYNVNNVIIKYNCDEGNGKSAYQAIPSDVFTIGIGQTGNQFTNLWVNVSATDCPDATAFKTWLASNPIQCVYPLKEEYKTVINLTPNEISLLEGVNNISTDGDKITLTYRDGSVATLGDVKALGDEMSQKIADSQILTDTVTGDKYKLVVTSGVLSIEQISN